MMKTLKLMLQHHLFESVITGDMTADCRDIKPYWVQRLIKTPEMLQQEFDELCKDLSTMQKFTSVTELLQFFGCSFRRFDTVSISSEKNGIRRTYQAVYMGTIIQPGIKACKFKILIGPEVSRVNC